MTDQQPNVVLPSAEVSHEAMSASIHFIREGFVSLDQKVDAFFRRLDEYKVDVGRLQTELAVEKVQSINHLKEFEKLSEKLNGAGGVTDRLRSLELKIGRVYAIGSFAVVSIGAAAVLIPLIFK